jgi:HD-like signal output (HDOD) protein/ActR/RegA family two-component response regulator
MTEEQVTKLIDQTPDFPRLSPIAAQIATMTSDLSAPVQEVADKIKSDEELLKKILKVVNTPLYRFADGVEDISEVINILGYKKVCNLALGVSVLGLFPTESHGGFDYGRHWERGICAGVAASEIASRLNMELPADLFTSGLLQDIGVLFLVKARPLEFGGAIALAKSQKVHAVKAEREVLGIDHARVGSVLCKSWELPSMLSEVIAHHHFAELEEPVPDGTRKVIQAVNLSSLMMEVMFDPDGEERREALDERAKAFFGFGPKMVDAIREKILEPAQQIGEAFSVEIDDGTSTPKAEEKPQAPSSVTCESCGAEDQTGKFCSECGKPLGSEKRKPKRDTRKVLIAEDSIASRRALSFVIKKLGYIPIEATNGYEAVELAMKDPPGMIMMDVMMPRMTGLEALKRIREEEATSHVPVVMLTSMTDSETVVEAVQSGANDYVVKPYTADLIAQRLKKYMPKQEKGKRRAAG